MKAFGHWSLLLNKKLNQNPFDTKALPIDFALIYVCMYMYIWDAYMSSSKLCQSTGQNLSSLYTVALNSCLSLSLSPRSRPAVSSPTM